MQELLESGVLSSAPVVFADGESHGCCLFPAAVILNQLRDMHNEECGQREQGGGGGSGLALNQGSRILPKCGW